MSILETEWAKAAQQIRDILGQEGLDKLAESLRSHYDLVEKESDACPDCGESRIDYLAWDDDGEFVTCTSCGCVYVP